MKIKKFGWCLFIIAILINIWAIFKEIHWLENSSSISFFLLAFLLVIPEYKKFNKFLYIFLGFTVLSYGVRFFRGEWFSNEISLILLTVAYIALIMEAKNHIEVKNAHNFTLLYFIAIVGINSCLLGFHVLEIKEYMSNDLIFSLYLLYYINLLILGIIAFIYYLNSYSRKSMFFISLALGIIFADVLRDMGIFYEKDYSVAVAESIIRSGSAVFAVMFFVTKEKQLRLVNLI